MKPSDECGRQGAYEEEGSDAADEAMCNIGADHDAAIGKTEGEPDREPRKAKPQLKAGVEDNGGSEPSVEALKYARRMLIADI